MEALRQSIEQNLFNDQLNKELNRASSNPQVIADLINAIVQAIQKEGLSGDLSAAIPQAVSARDVNVYLTEAVIKRLKDQSVTLSDFSGGAQVKFVDKNFTIDISEEAIKDLVSRYIRKDFRQLIFGGSQK